MDDFEQEAINEDLIEFAIRESIQDAYKLRTRRAHLHLNSLLVINIKNVSLCVALVCILAGDVDALQELSGCASAFRESDSRGWLPLHAAAVQLHGMQATITGAVVLESTDLTLEEQTEDGDTALTLAAEAGQVENIKLLLKHGASPHNNNSRNESPLLIAVRQRSYDMAISLIMGGAFVEQVCLTKWRAIHEAAKEGCAAIMMLLLRHGAKITSRDGHGVTPLGIAAEHGNYEVLDILIHHGKTVYVASNGDTVLYDATGSGNLDCVKLLLEHGANPNVASYACQLPIHRAAYEGYILDEVSSTVLLKKSFIFVSTSTVNAAENYGDLRKTPLYFAVSNGDVTCSERLLAAGARTDLDPLRCILVSILRLGKYFFNITINLLLSHGAEVNCYFRVISNTVFPTALQYCFRDHVMLRLLLNSGYHSIFDLFTEDIQPKVISFCEFVSVSCLAHVVGKVVRMLLDYVSHVSICFKLRQILQRRPEWEEISDILGKTPRSLQHLCRLVIRSHMSLRTLNDPETMAAGPFPTRLMNYLTYREYDLHGDLLSV
uniref:Ankyrin repeat and SOCS box containing 15b n=1 Tax=Neolamprologus brichardi TaxID=32507 RepID=A0A3Q4G4Y5_NEOBR